MGEDPSRSKARCEPVSDDAGDEAPKKTPTAKGLANLKSWKKGESGNRKGSPTWRARAADSDGLGLAEAIRGGVRPLWIVHRLLFLARHGKTESIKLAALEHLMSRGWVKPPIQVVVDGKLTVKRVVLPYDLELLTVDEKQTLLRLFRKAHGAPPGEHVRVLEAHAADETPTDGEDAPEHSRDEEERP